MSEAVYRSITYSAADGVAMITINRPDAMNALDGDVLRELDSAVDQVERAAAVRVAIITGAGKAFVAGADIAHMRGLSATECREFIASGQRLLARIEACGKPFIAAVNGYALGGGCELAMACDFRIASERAKFGQPEVGLGVIPGFGGTQRLARLVGRGRAKYYICTGHVIGAEEALRVGLVERVVPAEELMAAAGEAARAIAAKAPLAVAMAKKMIDTGLDMSQAAGVAAEAEAFASLFASGDRVEGMTAFLERRQPVFKGR